MNIDNNEKETGTVHMDIADQPAMIDITHDPFNGFKRMINMWRVVHSQNDTSDDHSHQRKTGK